jgi:hypothetical protein
LSTDGGTQNGHISNDTRDVWRRTGEDANNTDLQEKQCRQ